MTHSKRARTTPGPIQIRRSGAAVPLVIIAIAAALGHRFLSSSSTASSVTSTSSTVRSAPTVPAPIGGPRDEPPDLRSSYHRPLGEADGAIPDRTTVFADAIPGVAKLDPALLAALRKAATDAAREGIVFFVDSGWRSAAYQEQLLQQAVLKYGSEEEAARWVATPETSAHVSGEAVDVGRSDATAWLSEHGAEYGLCQIYSNEPWHYELRSVDHACPPMYADPTHDPRTRQ